MAVTARVLAAVMLGGCVWAGGQAAAQNRPSANSRNNSEPAPYSQIAPEGERPNVPPPISTLTPSRGIAGPRLDTGAVVCRSQADLQHRAQVQGRIANGDSDPGDALVNCHLLNQPRGVEIVSRAGLGRVQVKLKPSGEVGWTDAYLP